MRTPNEIRHPELDSIEFTMFDDMINKTAKIFVDYSFFFSGSPESRIELRYGINHKLNSILDREVRMLKRGTTMDNETYENFPRKEDLKPIAARYIDLTEYGYECAGIMVHSYRKPKSSLTIIEKILERLFRRTPMTETYRISLWANGKFLSCTDVLPEVWKYGNFSETPQIFRARILSNLVKLAMKRGKINGQEEKIA